MEDDMRIVAQCEDIIRLSHALDAYQGVILFFSSTMHLDAQALVVRARAAGTRTILVAENGSEVADELVRLLHGVIFRSVPESIWSTAFAESLQVSDASITPM